MPGFRKFLQAIAALLALAALVIAMATLYPVPRLSPFVLKYVLQNRDVSMVVAVILGLLACLAFIFFLYSCFAQSKAKKLRLTTENGEITVDRSVVENDINAACREVEGAKAPQASVKLGRQPEQTVVDLHVVCDEDTEQNELSQQLQEKARTAVERVLAASPKSINVHLKSIHDDHNSNAPRVR